MDTVRYIESHRLQIERAARIAVARSFTAETFCRQRAERARSTRTRIFWVCAGQRAADIMRGR